MSKSRLEVVVEAYVENQYPSAEKSKTRMITSALVESIQKETRDALAEAEVRALKKRLNREEKAHRQYLRRNTIAIFIIEAIAIAILVGLLVNQGTNLLEEVRVGMNYGVVAFALVLIVLLSLSLLAFILLHTSVKGAKEVYPDEE